MSRADTCAPESIPVEMNGSLAHAGGVLMMTGEIHQATHFASQAWSIVT